MRVTEAISGLPVWINTNQSMGSIMGDDKSAQYDEKESQARFEAALKGAMNASHKPLKEKPKTKSKKKPGKSRDSR